MCFPHVKDFISQQHKINAKCIVLFVFIYNFGVSGNKISFRAELIFQMFSFPNFITNITFIFLSLLPNNVLNILEFITSYHVLRYVVCDVGRIPLACHNIVSNNNNMELFINILILWNYLICIVFPTSCRLKLNSVAVNKLRLVKFISFSIRTIFISF